MCTVCPWSTLTNVELSLYMVLGELYIKSGRAVPSSESPNFQHLNLGRVVNSTAFREVDQNVTKVIISSENTSLKYCSFSKISSIVDTCTFAEASVIFVAICWNDIHGSELSFQESGGFQAMMPASILSLSSIAVKWTRATYMLKWGICLQHCLQYSAENSIFCTSEVRKHGRNLSI